MKSLVNQFIGRSTDAAFPEGREADRYEDRLRRIVVRHRQGRSSGAAASRLPPASLAGEADPPTFLYDQSVYQAPLPDEHE